MPPRITVVGDALLDVVAIGSEPMRPGGDVPATVRLEPGGQGANVAVRLARRGLDVRLVCALGDDAAGSILREALDVEGIEVVDLGAAATGTVVVLLDAGRDRTMLSHRAPLLGGGRSLDPSTLTDADWLIVSGYVLLEPSAPMSTSGLDPRRVVLGCSIAGTDVGTWTDAARSLSPHLVVLNTDEARAIAGAGAAPPAELARRLRDRLGSVVVVTHADGATAMLGDLTIARSEPAAGPPIDTTGAGDAFAAGLVAELIGVGWPPSPEAFGDAMRAGAVLAGAVTGVAGAQGRVAGEATARLGP